MDEPLDPLSLDLRVLMEKHKLDYAVLIMPTTDEGINLALAGVSKEQVWMICAELARRFNHKKEPLNG